VSFSKGKKRNAPSNEEELFIMTFLPKVVCPNKVVENSIDIVKRSGLIKVACNVLGLCVVVGIRERQPSP